MMTASSLEFFPCRVQLMGLPRSAGAPGNGVTTPRLNRNVTAPPNESRSSPPMAKLHAISRNLFGTPDPMEMNHLYQEETQRQRSYVMQRYNIDIETAKPTGNSKPLQQQQQQRQPQQQHQSLQPTETAVGTFAMPTLIEQELQQHEQRLQKEKCNLIRAAGATASTKQMTKGCNSDANIHQQPNVNHSGAKIVRSRSNVAITTNNNHNNNNNNCCKDIMSVPLAAERYKPYERQTLITDCYSLRKNKSHVMSVNGNKTTTITTVKGKNNQKMLLLSSPCSTSSSSQFSASVSSSSSSLSSSLQQNLEVLKATVVGGGQQPADIYLKLTNDGKTINGDNERNNNNNKNNNNYYDDNNSNTNNHHNDNDNNVVDIYKNNRIIRKDGDDDECAVVDAAAAATTTAPTTTVTVNDTTITSTDLILKVSVTVPPKVTVNDNQCNNTITAPQTQNQA